LAVAAALLVAGDAALNGNEFAAEPELWVVLLLQPIRVGQARSVVVRGLADGVEERLVQGHGGPINRRTGNRCWPAIPERTPLTKPRPDNFVRGRTRSCSAFARTAGGRPIRSAARGPC